MLLKHAKSAVAICKIRHEAWLVLLAAVAMTVLEGAFRKWILPGVGGAKYALYFSKDIIFAALLFFPRRSLPSPALRVFEKWLLPGCCLVGIGAGISCIYGLNPVGALLTLRALICLPIIAWLAVVRLTDLPLIWVLRLLGVFVILNFGLGTEQNRLPYDHILNRYADSEMQVVAVESGVRASGTFAYISGMAVISSVGVWAGLALMSAAKILSHQLFAWVVLAGGFGCGLASVSRGPIVVGIAMVLGWMIFGRKGISIIAKGLGSAVLCVIAGSELGITPFFSELGQGLMQRQETAGDSFYDRVFGQLSEITDALEYGALGQGFGTEQVGGQYYATGIANFNHFESPLPRLVMETGVLGLIGYLMVCTGAIMALQTIKRKSASIEVKTMLLATQLLLVTMFYGNVIFNHTASAFTWIIFAAVMASTEGPPLVDERRREQDINDAGANNENLMPSRPRRERVFRRSRTT